MTMHHKLIHLLDAILMTFVAFYITLTGLPFATLLGIISSVISLLYWTHRAKYQADKYHNGNLWEWFMYIFKHKKDKDENQ